MELGALVRELDAEHLLNPLYVQRLAKGAGSGGGGGPGGFHDDEGVGFGAAPPPPPFSDLLGGFS